MNEGLSIHARLGDEKLLELIDAFYNRVLKDDRINHLFKNDIDTIKKKQFMFLSQFFGGPPRYAETFGHPRMRMRHMPHEITADSAMAWLENMGEAIRSLQLDPSFAEEIFSRFPNVAAHMVNKA